ncbi:stage II sporulation protein P [Salimicrobium halophilum]|uniref:Stage II sporulation protein P n=1 Tax=Salimicrobium halophilum TaxID=86666 RepID=A0A1G8PP42_9BACI|nr:stage II sporulation protein P [Salimicrobium halophilum]SDI94319.1 stage II sporulation protein P [Salimicrobium halophilum]
MGKRFFYRKDKWQLSMLVPLFIAILILSVALLTGVKSTYRVYSDTVQQITSKMEGESFLYFLKRENVLFGEAGPERSSMARAVFESMMDIRIDDARTLFGTSIPGLNYYHDRIIIAGEGTDYTNLPVESEPPLDVSDEENEGSDDIAEPSPFDSGNPEVFIYHSHNTESFLPHLASGSSAYHPDTNITLVGKRLGNELQGRGISSKVNTMDVTAVLKDKGWKHYQSYDATRGMVEETLAQNESIDYLLDIHRDSLGKKTTTTTIQGKKAARTMFVVGAEHSGYEKNLKLATDLHKLLEQKYPGLSRGVITKQGAGVNGIYNQDLHPNALVVEFGGKENTFEELYRTADMFADVLNEYMTAE